MKTQYGPIRLYADEQPACAPFSDYEKTRRAIAKRDARWQKRDRWLALGIAGLFAALMLWCWR